MIMRLVVSVAFCLSMALTTGCLGVQTPAMGLLLTDVKWDGGGDGKQGPRTGRACAKSVLGLVASGDASIKAAAKNGRITNITSVDHETTWTLLIGEYCTIVHGT